jgi:hypothetical protein
MINKISNLKLILGLVILGLVYLAVVFFDSSKSVELEKQLISIDTSLVTQITIQGQDETVNLYRQGSEWQIALNTGKRVKAMDAKVTAFLKQLLVIGTDRLAAKEKSKWADYNVDSTGTHIQVRQGEEISLDMVVGKSGANNYLRLIDEVEVYTSDNFTGLGINDKINNYRENTLIKVQSDSIKSIEFDYPGDSSFQLINKDGRWNYENNTAADSAKTADYLRNMSLKYNSNFAGQDGSSLGPQIAQITINVKNGAPVTLIAYADPADSVVYQSSVSPESFFNDPSIGKDYFIGRASFMTAEE